MIPRDYRNPEEPTWAEASKWLSRQAHLFNKGKLTPLRAIIIREVLGEHHISNQAVSNEDNMQCSQAASTISRGVRLLPPIQLVGPSARHHHPRGPG